MCIDSGRPKKGRGLVKWRSNALHCFAAFCITCNPIRERPALEMKLEGGWDDNLFFLRPARRGHDMTNHAPEEADGERERERRERTFLISSSLRLGIMFFVTSTSICRSFSSQLQAEEAPRGASPTTRAAKSSHERQSLRSASSCSAWSFSAFARSRASCSVRGGPADGGGPRGGGGERRARRES